MDIRSKLGLYKENTQAQPASPMKDTGAKNAGLEIQDLAQGTVCSNGYGSFYMMESRYPSVHTHGGCSLGEALKTSHAALSALSGEDCNTPVENLLFLDTETTGLSGGAGTVAFLVGVGRFEKDSFVVRQYFMRDYDEEAAMLHELNALLSESSGLVTFNGKAFDWNLLQGRFTANRLRPGLREPVHIDLLYSSRRIWGLKLESCRLSSLEENVLGEPRTDDIPGAMIPGVYFKYVDDRDASDIKRVLKHNELDILSMVSLLVRISAMLESPLAQADGSHELLGLGRIYEARGGYDMAVDCLEMCSKSDIFAVKTDAVKRLTRIYKRDGRYDRAVGHWNGMASGAGLQSLFPLIELAKYYEHREKDIPKALELVDRAIGLSLQSGLTEGKQLPELKKRQERLKRKVAGNGIR